MAVFRQAIFFRNGILARAIPIPPGENADIDLSSDGGPASDLLYHYFRRSRIYEEPSTFKSQQPIHGT